MIAYLIGYPIGSHRVHLNRGRIPRPGPTRPDPNSNYARHASSLGLKVEPTTMHGDSAASRRGGC